MQKPLHTFVFALLFTLGATGAFAEKRIALVIGNSAYETISALDNPKNDADLMRKTLEEVGFEVVLAKDATFSDMRRAIRSFGRKLRAGGKDAVGLFYYAGHGVQSHGGNYLIPIGAEVGDEADLVLETISITHILRQMEGAGNRLNLVILDACRNNPFKSMVRSGARGLTRITSASGTLVAFSAAPGQVAVDGTADNSPYTAALAKFIREPGLQVEQLFKKVRNAVEDETGGRQTPWEESSLRGEFYFAGRSITVTEKPEVEPETKPEAETTASPSNAAFELTFWNSIKDTSSVESYEAYLKAYPQGGFAPLARIRIKQLKSKAKQQAAVTAVPTKKVTEATPKTAPYHRCDRLAASSSDPARKGDGVVWFELESHVTKAVDACRAAVGVYPDVARFEYQLGRSLAAAKNDDESLRWMRSAAQKGYPAAIASVGHAYMKGLGVKRDYQEALRWLRKAADQDFPGAYNSMGYMYKSGFGVPKDLQEALRLYRKAAELGDPSAMGNLARRYYSGDAVTKDYRKAFDWYLKAARVGDLSSMTSVGWLYYSGQGTSKDYAEALKWTRKAAEQDEPYALTNLGLHYEEGNGVVRDYGEAMKWYRRSAAKEHVRAYRYIADLYSSGKGVQKDLKAAAEWYDKAVRKGNTQAMISLGNILVGNGALQDYRRARELYENASSDQPVAWTNLAVIYDRGLGVAADAERAAQLVARGLKAGDPHALRQMTEHPANWSKPFRRALQKILRDAGDYPGGIDGDFGQGTVSAIKRYVGG